MMPMIVIGVSIYIACGLVTYVAIMFDNLIGTPRRDPWKAMRQAAVWPWTLWSVYR